MADKVEQSRDRPDQAAAGVPVQDSLPRETLGHDVAFRPRTGRGHQFRPQADAEEVQHRGPTALLEEEAEEEAAQETEARQLHPAKRRQLRNKASVY